jgi:hypothetical protein
MTDLINIVQNLLDKKRLPFMSNGKPSGAHNGPELFSKLRKNLIFGSSREMLQHAGKVTTP